MDAWTIISAVSGALVSVGIPLVGYLVKRRDEETGELKREVTLLRERLQQSQLDGAHRDTRIAVLESKLESIEHIVTRDEFERAINDLALDIREIKRFVIPAPSPGRYGGRFGSSDSLHAQKDPKAR